MDEGQSVLVRRLVGAAVLLLLAFGLSLVLPDPSRPPGVEDGMQRVELRIADGERLLPAAKGEQVSDHSSGAPLETAASAEIEAPAPADDPVDADGADDAHAEAGEAAESPGPPDATPAPVARKAPSQMAEAAATSPAGKKPADTAPKALSGTASKPVPKTTPNPAAVAAAPAPPAASTAMPLATPVPAPPAAPSKPVAPPPPSPAAPTPPVLPIPAQPAAASAAASAAAKPADPVVPPGTGKPWLIQAGVFADISNAREVENKLKALGYGSTLSIIESGGGARYRVRCGPFATRDLANAARARLEQNRIPSSLVPQGG